MIISLEFLLLAVNKVNSNEGSLVIFLNVSSIFLIEINNITSLLISLSLNLSFIKKLLNIFFNIEINKSSSILYFKKLLYLLSISFWLRLFVLFLNSSEIILSSSLPSKKFLIYILNSLYVLLSPLKMLSCLLTILFSLSIAFIKL